MRVIFLILFIFSSFSTYSQSKGNYYLNFLGKEYQLKDSINLFFTRDDAVTFQNNVLVRCITKPILYKFCGKGFFIKESVHVQAKADNPFSVRILTKNYIDSCIYEWILDSLKNTSPDLKGFHIYKNNKKYSIYSFKVFFDSTDVEEEFLDEYLSSDREKQNELYSPNFAEEVLKAIVLEHKESTKFLIVDITYIDVIEKKKFKLDSGFLITR